MGEDVSAVPIVAATAVEVVPTQGAGEVIPALPTTIVVPTAKPVKARPTAKPAIVWNVIAAKAAYRAQRISKVQYKAIIEKLESQYEYKIRQLKLAYRAGSISRDTYEQRVQVAKRAFRGD